MQSWDAFYRETLKKMEAERNRELGRADNVKCPYCGSTDARYIPEVKPTSFRLWHCNNCSKGFTVCVTIECPECGSTDISLCYAGEGNVEIWCCNDCKKVFSKGDVVE